MFSFFLSMHTKACMSHFDPNFITVQQQHELWGNVPTAGELFKFISECSLQRKNSCSESSSGVFSSPYRVFQEVQSEAGSLHNMQNTHTHTLRGCTGRAQVGEREPLMVRASQCLSGTVNCPPTSTEELSNCLVAASSSCDE